MIYLFLKMSSISYILLIFEHEKYFQKEYKYTLGQDLKREGINFTSLPLKNQQNIIFGKQQTNKQTRHIVDI
jgi:hypothetical protein|tara:strand:- start:103 stop:318 length:216 start_codon:yes stop_codon:yes gene_type:complete